MMKRSAALLLCLVALTGCGRMFVRTTTDVVNDLEKWTPEKLEEASRKSNVVYRVTYREGARSAFWPDSLRTQAPDPAWVRVAGTGGRPARLEAFPTKPCAAELSEKAVAAFRKGDAAGALALYGQAAECDPENHVVHAQIGRLKFLAGDLDGAEKALRRALALNASSAEAHEALARTLARKNDLPGARKEIVEAILLDGDGESTLRAAKEILLASGEYMDDDRLFFPWELSYGPDTVTIFVDSAKAGPNPVLPLCQAMWDRDPAFLTPRSDDNMVREVRGRFCFGLLGKETDRLLREGREPKPWAAEIRKTAEDGLLNAMIVWEGATGRFPGVIHLMDDASRALMRVYVETRVVRKIPESWLKEAPRE